MPIKESPSIYLETRPTVERISIAEIFEEDGEPAFRQLEHEAVIQASQMGPVIVSLGGGAIMYERNWDVIRKTGA